MRSDRFEAEVKRRSWPSHMVILTGHVKEQMLAREITQRQVINALRKGTLASGPTWSEDHGDWLGKMKYHGTGREITVVFAIAERLETVEVVTVY
jgi:hypothetical protein